MWRQAARQWTLGFASRASSLPTLTEEAALASCRHGAPAWVVAHPMDQHPLQGRGSLACTPQDSLNSGHGVPTSSRRHMSTKADPTEFLAPFRKYMQPDQYDAHEYKLATLYSSAKASKGRYHRPRGWDKGKLDALGDRLGPLLHRVHARWVCFRSISRYGFQEVFWDRALITDASEAYRRISKALAGQNRANASTVEQLVTPNEFKRINIECKGIAASPNQVHFEIVGDRIDAEVVDGTIVQMIPDVINKQRPSKLRVAQFTVRLVSEQRCWIVDKKGKVVSGSKDAEAELVEEFWVFERPFYASWFIRKPGPQGARWRLVEVLKNEDVYNVNEEERREAVGAAGDKVFKALTYVAIPSIMAYALYHLWFT